MNEGSVLVSRDNSFPSDESEVAYSSNSVRLSGYELIFVCIVTTVLFWFGPRLWQRIEKFEPESGFRMHYELSNDYWLYSRYCRWAASK